MPSALEDLRAALAGRYDILNELGQGGMATVYLADDLRHERKVAVKVLRPDLAAALGAERFLREIKIAANLTHPHILPLHDSGEADGFLYYVMPYIAGNTLRQRLEREGALPVGDAVTIIREVTDALAAAHAQGVVHRDIKPDNIMLSGRHAMVMDFGVAKAVSEATGRNAITTAGVALGTPAYMAPEQATAEPHVDHRADIYAVGVMAYEILAGRPPFEAASAQAVLAAHVTAEADPVSKHRDQVSPDLEAVVMKCLAKKPADRWQSAEEMLPHLEAGATPSGGMTPTATRPVAATGSPSGRRWLAPVVVVALLAVSAFWFLGRDQATGGGEAVATRLAVFPFRVSGPDDEVGYLREGLVHLMSTALDGAGDVRTLDPQSALTAVGDTDLDAPAARDAAGRMGAGMFVLGNATSVGPGRVQVSAALYLAGAEDPIRAQTTGSPDSALVLTGRLVRQLLAGYSAAQPAGIDSLGLLTTESVDALKAYLAGMAEYRRSRWSRAIEAFETAVAFDSTFALAYYMMSRAASWAERQEQGVQAARMAQRFGDRLSQRHRDLIEAALAMEEGRPLEAEQLALDVIRAYPEDYDGWYLLGETRLHFASLMGRPIIEAKEPFDRAVAIDPGRGDAFSHAYDMAMRSRDIEEVERLYRIRAGAETGDTSAVRVTTGLRIARVLAGGGDAVADSVRAALDGVDEFTAVYWAYRTGAWWGHQPSGLALAEYIVETGDTPLDRAMGQRHAAVFELVAGRRQAARRHLRASAQTNAAEAIVAVSFDLTLGFPPADEPDLRAWRDTLLAWDAGAVPPCNEPDPTGFLCVHEGDYALLREFFLGVAAARLDEEDVAIRQADVLEHWDASPDDPYLPADLAHIVRGLVAARENRPEDALAELDLVSASRDAVKVRASRLYGMAPRNFFKAQVLQELGRYDEAVRLYTAAGDAGWNLAPAADLGIGEIHEARGETELALERYGTFVDLWSDADPEFLPLVEDVRNRMARLAGEPAP
jgi:tRNA A-37 threonylcarbamoyl transferase component Bud32/tetratricopeptide (TPR) repeat protein